MVNLPFFLDGQRGEVHQRAPRLGEHTRELLAGMGYPEAEIAALLDSGAVQGE
jgi:crotonobetainyl-CoA:carnitine CoA-transferase CaiB-like acyl-CoA transferase